MTTTDSSTQTRLSTGHEVELPLELSFAMGGVTVPARRSRLAAILPTGLSSLAIAPGIGCVTLVGIQYRRVGGDSDQGLEPYDEFAVIVPAVRGSRTELSFAQLVDGEIGGYVHWLPVTTDASVALGREIWGYPKERAAITVTDGPNGIRATVEGGRYADEGPLRLAVARPSGARERDWTMASYTTTDGGLVRTRARIRGEIALGPGPSFGTRLSVPSGLARDLGCWERPLARLSGTDLRAQLFAGERPAARR